MFSDLQEVYKNKKVLVTGHTGFKGAWLVRILNLLGANVTGYSLAPEEGHNLYDILNIRDACASVIGDLRDKIKLKSIITGSSPDFIFHLAAQPLVRLSYEIPSETFEVNAIGTANLLDAIRLLKNPCSVVLITTDKVYYNYEWAYPYRENDRLGGYDPYSASKACAELVIDSYRNSFFNVAEYNRHKKGIAVARAGNVIGGGDWAKDRLIPDIVRSLSKNDKIEIRNPFSVRPWQHVLEPLGGYLLLAARLSKEPLNYSKPFNFGPDVSDALVVEAMVKLAVQSWGSGEYFVNANPDMPHEAGLLKLDISNAVAEIGWKPLLNAASALNLTISWYKEYFKDPQNIKLLTDSQIVNFFNF